MFDLVGALVEVPFVVRVGVTGLERRTVVVAFLVVPFAAVLVLTRVDVVLLDADVDRRRAG